MNHHCTDERTHTRLPTEFDISTIVGQGSIAIKAGDGAPAPTFESWDPHAATGVEVMGRCQHPLTAGSGTGIFAGATGRLDFKDEVSTGLFFYRGHITLG